MEMEELKPGDKVGPYRIQRKLKEGGGGMSVVYEAAARASYRQPGWPERFAVKIAVPEYEDFLKRESDFLSRLDHAHVVKVYPIRHKEYHNVYLARHPFPRGWSPYFAMEFVEGESLEELIGRQGRLGLRPAVGIARQVASALAHIHSHDLIHLDVKPRNILFRRCRWAWFRAAAPRAVLCDFGLARGPGYPPPDKKAGTPPYMSPEQFQEGIGAECLVDRRSDIFSVGVVLYEMLTGQYPFDNPAELMQTDPGPPRELNRRIPGQLEAIILCCLAKEPGRRYQTAEELDRALAALPLPPDWGLMARYSAMGLLLAGGLWGGGRACSSVTPVWFASPTASPTRTPTVTLTATVTPSPAVTHTPTEAMTPGVVTSTPLPTHTPTPTPRPTATPTETPSAPTVEATP
jgi:serine/threonine-protein kinase